MSRVVVASVLLAAGLLANLPAAVAQTSNATCLSSFAWMSNSRRQSPCLVAAYLQAACFSDGEFTVQALPPDTHYSGPYASQADACQCSTVSYSMISACGLCQNHTILPLSTWSTNCTTSLISNSKYPKDIPAGTTVPGWAYLSVQAKDTFDPVAALAMADTNVPESTATKAQSTSIPSSSATLSSNAGSKPKSNNVGAIAGGVVGGVVLLGLIAALVIFLVMRRKRQSKMAPSASYSPTYNNGYQGNNTNVLPQTTYSPGPQSPAMSEQKFYEDTANFYSPTTQSAYSEPTPMHGMPQPNAHLHHPGVPEI